LEGVSAKKGVSKKESRRNLDKRKIKRISSRLGGNILKKELLTCILNNFQNISRQPQRKGPTRGIGRIQKS